MSDPYQDVFGERQTGRTTRMLERAVRAIEQGDGVLIVVNTSAEVRANDQAIVEMLHRAGLPARRYRFHIYSFTDALNATRAGRLELLFIDHAVYEAIARRELAREFGSIHR